MVITPIIWKTFRPIKFPCFACEENRALFSAQIKYRGEYINTCLCPTCANLPETEIIDKIFGRS